MTKRLSIFFTDISCSHLGIVILLLLLFFIPAVQSIFNSGNAQAIIYWQNKDGTGTDFNWQNGGSDKGLFGEPTLIGGNILQFSPTNFCAQSTNGASTITSDRLQFDIIVHPGREIKGIEISEEGYYGILLEGTVSAGGVMLITNLNQFETRKALFQTDPVMPISTPAVSDLWSGEVAIGGLNWTHLKVVLSNELIALSSPWTATSIEKDSLNVEIITIPEPTTIGLLGLGGLTLLRRKKIHG